MEIGAEPLRVLGKVLPQVSNTPFEGPLDTPFNLDGTALAVGPVLHQSCRATGILDGAHGNELITLDAVIKGRTPAPDRR